jgi:integrase
LIQYILNDIIQSQEVLQKMGRRRYQKPSVLKTVGKKPSWYFRARVDTIVEVDETGKKLARPEDRYYLGYCDEMTKQEAKEKRDTLLSEVINKPQVAITSQVKFKEVLKVYLDSHLSELRETTQKAQKSTIETHITTQLGELKMCEFNVLAVQRWLSSLHVSYGTKYQHLRLLKCIWNKALEWGYTQNAFPKSKYALGVRRAVKGHEMPTMEQLQRLLAALDDPFKAMAEVALYSGLRISEIRGLKWEDIGTTSFSVKRRIAQTGDVDVPKNTRTRVIDVRPIEGVLARLPRLSEWVFNNSGCSYKMCNLKMQAARKVAGIQIALFSWHHLRAVCNTLARSVGADSVDRQAVLGHSTEDMNNVYVMQSPDDLRRRGDQMLAVQSLIMGQTKGIQ